MILEELKSLFLEYCRKKACIPDKQLFGLEYENFVMVRTLDNGKECFDPLPVEGDSGVTGVLNNLAEMTKNSKDPLEKVFEKNMLLALISPAGTKITIEPGGQIELSDAPRQTLLEVHNSFQAYLKLLIKAVSGFDGRLLFQGVQPVHSLENLPFFPKNRYQIMFQHMLKKGTLGQWMMKGSSGVQVSIDYSSLEDLHRKFIFLNRLSPFLTAMFANSPLNAGSPCGFLSYRSHIWANTDNSRCGLPDFFLSDKFLLEDYINWALKATPYHLMRESNVVETTNWNFKQLLEGKHPGIKITTKDWEDHLGMIFPDIRIKNILEVRVVDSVLPKYTMAIPALIGTLLYNESAFSSAQSLLMDLPLDEFKLYKKAAAKDALQGEVNQTNFAKIGSKLAEIALQELGSINEIWLLPFFEKFTKEGRSPANETLDQFQECGKDPDKWLAYVLNNPDY